MDRRNFLTGVVGAGLVTGVLTACTPTARENAAPGTAITEDEYRGSADGADV